jgi:lipopolysaccharide transport system ATP-binding protein
VISVRNLSKVYQIYDRPLDRLKQSLQFGGTKYFREFWALRDVSFEVERGEMVGIVGVNGSGKSTLLQLIAGTLTPTAGQVQVDGRVHALLELGAGFNPHFTGRQNVYLTGTIHGLAREQIDELLPKIEEFAGIGKFLDQPVRLYSSGMYVRLAFALQTMLPKEVFIIDEALAVGDELFQRKCFSALSDFHEQGGTVLFVSHSATLVKQLCRRAVLIDAGELLAYGDCKAVVDEYQKYIYLEPHRKAAFREELRADAQRFVAPPEAAVPAIAGKIEPAAGASVTTTTPTEEPVDFEPDFDPELVSQSPVVYAEQGAKIVDIRIENGQGQRVNVLRPGEKYRYCYDVKFDQDCRDVLFGMVLKTPTGLELGGSADDKEIGGGRHVAAGTTLSVSFEFNARLLHGTYFANCGVTGRCGEYDGFLARIVDAFAFRVKQRIFRKVTGYVDFEFQPRVSKAA